MFRTLRRILAYLLVRSLVAIAETLPRHVGRPLFGKLGGLGYFLLKGARNIALTNLKLVYGRTSSDKDIVRIARGAFVNLGKFAYDVARMRKYSRRSLRRMVDVVGKERLDRVLAGGKGVIAITGHIGNWELLAAYFSIMGYPVNVLATALKDNRLNSLLTSIRKSARLIVLDRETGLRSALRCLRRGEILGILIDQDTSVDSVVVDFLGEPAKTAVGPVKLADSTGAAIVPLAMLMTDDGGYRIEVSEPVDICGDEASLAEDVAKCSKAVEMFIRENPTQWVWMHKRWKSVRTGIYDG
jgi:KDO2-lipid IV(A) lauroyltransferase